MRLITKILLTSLVCVLLLQTISDCCIAAGLKDPDPLSVGMMKPFADAKEKFIPKFKSAAETFFLYFTILGLCLFGIRVAISSMPLNDAMREFFSMMTFAAFIFCAIFYFDEWTETILGGQEKLIMEATGQDHPLSGGILNLGLRLFNDKIKPNIGGIFDLDIALGYVLIGGIVLCIHALLVARLIVLKCESYISLCVAVLIMSAGGWSYTKDYAINTIKYVFSLAVKLMTMELIMAFGTAFIATQVNGIPAKDPDLAELLLIAASSLILFVIAMSLPESVAGIISGSHSGSGAGLKGAAGSVVGAAGTFGKMAFGAAGAAAGGVGAAVNMGKAGLAKRQARRDAASGGGDSDSGGGEGGASQSPSGGGGGAKEPAGEADVVARETLAGNPLPSAARSTPPSPGSPEDARGGTTPSGTATGEGQDGASPQGGEAPGASMQPPPAGHDTGGEEAAKRAASGGTPDTATGGGQGGASQQGGGGAQASMPPPPEDHDSGGRNAAQEAARGGTSGTATGGGQGDAPETAAVPAGDDASRPDSGPAASGEPEAAQGAAASSSSSPSSDTPQQPQNAPAATSASSQSKAAPKAGGGGGSGEPGRIERAKAAVVRARNAFYDSGWKSLGLGAVAEVTVGGIGAGIEAYREARHSEKSQGNAPSAVKEARMMSEYLSKRYGGGGE